MIAVRTTDSPRFLSEGNRDRVNGEKWSARVQEDCRGFDSPRELNFVQIFHILAGNLLLHR